MCDVLHVFTVMMKGTVLIISKRKDTWKICSQMFPYKKHKTQTFLPLELQGKQAAESCTVDSQKEKRSPSFLKHLILHLNQILQLTSILTVTVTNDSG